MPKIRKPKNKKFDLKALMGDNFLAVIFISISCLCALLYLIINNLLYNQTFQINDLRSQEQELHQEIKELKSHSINLERIDRFEKFMAENDQMTRIRPEDVVLIENETGQE
jgi:cell division protein FtsI/penicillin-binding protein 2